MNNNNNIWYLPYGDPAKNSTILNDDKFNEPLNPIFQNVHHPHNPQYNYTHANSGQLNHNMLEGQPEYQKEKLTKAYTGKHTDNIKNKLGLLADSIVLDADIKWNNSYMLSPTQQSQQNDLSYHHHKIDPDFKVLPDGQRNFRNPNVMSGPLTQIVPWDSFNNDEQDDEFFNERNFQKIYNHPFYNQMKPMLEQPFKNL